jgi:enoyl-CoA hydratase/carnithine racemase
VAAARQMLWGMLGAGSPWTAHRVDSKAIYTLGAQADVAEGVASFLEKRPPKFPLRVSESYPDFIPPWPAH